MWGVNQPGKGIDHTWAALRTIQAARPDGAPVSGAVRGVSSLPLRLPVGAIGSVGDYAVITQAPARFRPAAMVQLYSVPR
jgi:hypothetical protein